MSIELRWKDRPSNGGWSFFSYRKVFMCIRPLGVYILAIVFASINGDCFADGIISVHLSNRGQLRMTGDSAANHVQLELGEDGQVVITATGNTQLEWEDDLTDSVLVPGVERVRVRLLRGKDRLSISGTPLAPLSALSINTGGDNDFIELKDVSSTGQYTISGGGGDDLIIASLMQDAIGKQPTFVGGVGYDEKMGEVDGRQRSIESSSLLPTLSRNDPDHNTSFIAAKLSAGETVDVAPGVWPVRPLSLGSGDRIVGAGVGVSELRLVLDVPPGRFDDQHVIATRIPPVANGFTTGVYVAHLTLNGNLSNNDWSNVYNDGNAHGLLVRAAEDSLFENLEIKNCYTDGINVATVLGQDNNPRRVDFRNIEIHHAGRQGVSVVGGETLSFNNFDVHSIGRDGVRTSPRSAIDLEPEPNAQRFVRDISITNWNIRRCGQGVLLTGTGSSVPAEDITVRNIVLEDLDGPQILSATDISNLVVENFDGKDHFTTGGVGVRFRNAHGTVDDLSIQNLQGTNYPLQIDGDSDMELSDIVVENAGRSVMQVGGEPNQPAQNTLVKLDGFEFKDVGNTAGLPVVRVKSAGYVEMTDGEISQVGITPYTISLFTDVFFDGCVFQPGQQAILTPGLDGNAIGQSF